MKLDAVEQAEITNHLRKMGVDKADAAGVWTTRQLTAALNRAYESEVPPNNALSLFPVTNEIPDYAKYFSYPSFDGVGLAQIITDYANDLPLIDALATEQTGRVFRMGNAFLISIDEIKAGAALNSNLSTRKQTLAFEAHRNKVDELVWRGSPAHGINSIFTAPNTNSVEPGAAWSTAEDASAAINRLVDSIDLATRGVHMANRIMLPASVRRLMQTLVPQTGISYQQLFQQNNQGVQLIYLNSLDNYDGAGGKAAIAFEFDPLNLSIEVTEAVNALPAQPKDLHFKIPVTSKTTGLVIYRPMTVSVMRGITLA
jgi:hypothetical protein